VSYLGTVSATDDGYFYETYFDGVSNGKISVEAAKILAKRYIQVHKDAIAINETTLRYIEEEKHLALTSDEQRLFNLVKLVKFNYWPGYLGMYLEEDSYFAVYDADGNLYRKSNTESIFAYENYPAFLGDFSRQDIKMMIGVLCQIYNNSAGELADYIEEKRRPKPTFEVLSTDNFSIYKNSKDTWLVRDGKEAVVVASGSPSFDDHWEDACLFDDYVACSFEEGVRRMREAGWDVTVTQVKPEWPIVKKGNRVMNPEGEIYIVAVISPFSLGLIDISDGERWTEPVKCNIEKPINLQSLVNVYSKEEYPWKVVQ